MLKVNLKKNLVREIKRGHQWLYKDSLETLREVNKAELAILKFNKEDLAWGFYDPFSPIGFRVLNTGKKLEPIFKKLEKALRLRSSILNNNTTGFRLVNGEGDLLPGLICDIYDSIAIIQFDGKGPEEFWRSQNIESWLIDQTTFVRSVYFKPRKKKELEFLKGDEVSNFNIEFEENGVKFNSNLAHGQKTGFFLDQRDNRDYVRSVSLDKTVVNLFSYTGGFSIYAGLGGALKVDSVDVSKGAISEAVKNWELNKLSKSLHEGIAEDVFKYIDRIKGLKDMIIVDPPSMTSSKDSKATAQNKYIDLFSKAAAKVKSGGDLMLSSCSSQVSFEDFDLIIKESLSKSRRTGQILRVSGQGIDHPYPHNQPELRYLKFVHIVLN